MKSFQIKEFIPTILFLTKFIGIYLVGNFLYGLYVTSYEPSSDRVTYQVTNQTAIVLTTCGWSSRAEVGGNKPITNLNYGGKNILAVYEGCNGINVMIIFVAFLFAIGPVNRSLLWFIPLGLIIIHVFNLMRIILLFLISIYYPDQMYFMHKYLFTAVLYVVVFVLWVFWTKRLPAAKTVTT